VLPQKGDLKKKEKVQEKPGAREKKAEEKIRARKPAKEKFLTEVTPITGERLKTNKGRRGDTVIVRKPEMRAIATAKRDKEGAGEVI